MTHAVCIFPLVIPSSHTYRVPSFCPTLPPSLSTRPQFTNEYRNFNYSGLGLPGIQTSTGAAGIRFKQQNLLFKAKWYIKEVRNMGRAVW